MAKKKERKPNKGYRLQKVDLSDTDKRILSCDPGSRNFGIACSGVTKENEVQVLANAVLKNPMHDLAHNSYTALLIFLAEIGYWVKLYQPHAIIVERFQTRGFGGPLIEQVSGMNLAICAAYKHLPSRLITASTWKNAHNKRFNMQLDEMYAACNTEPHQLDATLIGLFGLEAALQKQLSYTPKGIIRQVEKTACVVHRKEYYETT